MAINVVGYWLLAVSSSLTAQNVCFATWKCQICEVAYLVLIYGMSENQHISYFVKIFL